MTLAIRLPFRTLRREILTLLHRFLPAADVCLTSSLLRHRINILSSCKVRIFDPNGEMPQTATDRQMRQMNKAPAP